jgi:hypothetical protein
LTPTATATGGAWHVTLNAPGMATNAQYLGVGMYFSGNAAGTDCIDAAAFAGVRFDIGGIVYGNGCTTSFSIYDSEHTDASFGGTGSGPPGSYSPQLALTVTGSPQTISVPFIGFSAPAGGEPATAIDKRKLLGLQWQFTVPASASAACTVDLTIDNVRFF